MRRRISSSDSATSGECRRPTHRPIHPSNHRPPARPSRPNEKRTTLTVSPRLPLPSVQHRVAVEDATVADVTERTNVPVFNRIAQALTQDVVALLPTAGADDLDGCEAAASAVHRSVASGAQTDDVASAKRVEQGLRRLAVSIDKTSPAAGCKTHELLEMLAGYVQAGTMLARRKRQSIPKDSATTDAIGDDAAKDAMDVDGASSSRMDEVQSERASRAI